MSYIGNQPTTASFPLDIFNGDASTTQFTLTQSPGSASAVDVHVGSIYQTPGSGYTVSGSVITFTSAPPTGTNNIVVVHKGVQVQIPTPGAGTVGRSQIATGQLSPIVQIVRTDDGEVATGTTILLSDDSIPQNTEGDEFLTVIITPTSSTNNLVIESSITVSSTVANWIIGALFQDSIVGAISANASYATTGTGVTIINIDYEMVAGTTSATTFKIRVGQHSAGTLTFNGKNGVRILGGVVNSYIKVTEILQ